MMIIINRSTYRSWNKSSIRYIKRYFSNNLENKLDPSIMLREVMRNVAQPVAIAVTSVPKHSSLFGKSKYHGATLTSFTSLTLYPIPLVAFSLRLPSRMADCLKPPSQIFNEVSDEYIKNGFIKNDYLEKNQSSIKSINLPLKSELPWPLFKLPIPEKPPNWAINLLSNLKSSSSQQSLNSNPLNSSSSSSSNLNSINSNFNEKSIINSNKSRIITISLLSKENEEIANSLSLPCSNHNEIFNLSNTWDNNNFDDNNINNIPPSLKNSIGNLKCEIIQNISLKDLSSSSSSSSSNFENDILEQEKEKEQEQEQKGSELFICKVLNVNLSNDKNLQPLLHWRRKYVGIKDFE
ncbi:uncharacterized protein I206_107116 [Kwoniella pini CBS 10737]|uniref:Flavin reductase like domain-containing protein n=1 Tax=Kwoniella pini CBS 10737 TaxID=1296096 RepID=A0A1B9HZ97_9TREE|nr:uncharacterized protein I206_05340 [Kwoniella pini CBS 10737]OCF48561.1 hypothetical protein I206_05340 [Kwoniella pini CBS 10737]